MNSFCLCRKYVEYLKSSFDIPKNILFLILFISLEQSGSLNGCQMVYFQAKNTNLGIFEGLRMENVGIFYGHLEYITAIGYILWSLGKLVVIWYIVSRKIWQP
jgi:hypothetical protein